ncbi:hypothetical protein M569_04081, partial [Genlisea aurea]
RSLSLASSSSSLSASEKPISSKTPQTTVTCVYQAHIAGSLRNVTVLWAKNLMNHSLSLSVDSVDPEVVSTCKIDLKPWYFWAKKGYRTFEVDGSSQIEVYWDLRSAKFSGSPEPFSDYYVALVAEDEVALLLGDLKKKVFKRTKARPALVEAVIFYKKENVFGKKSFSTRAKFDQMKQDHDIVVESSILGPREPEMWISIDGIVLIHVTNLHWKFRGNQTVIVNKQPIQVFWDVHSWLFCVPGSGHGVFIFKSSENEGESDNDSSSHCDDSECSNSSRYFSTQSYSKKDFSLFLYAWKIE